MKRIIKNIERYLKAVDDAELANDNDNYKAEEKAVNKQFDEYEKLMENYTKTAIKKACVRNENTRVRSFYTMYIK